MAVRSRNLEPAIQIVGGNARSLARLRGWLAGTAYSLQTYATVNEFLATWNDRSPSDETSAPWFDCGCELSFESRPFPAPGCLLLVHDATSESDGLQLPQILADRGWHLPIVYWSAGASVATAVTAMKLGAVDFLDSAANRESCLAALAEALRRDAAFRADFRQRLETGRRLADLSPREFEVVQLLLDGREPREIARLFGTAYRTVCVQRRAAFKKLRVGSPIQLVRKLHLPSHCSRPP